MSQDKNVRERISYKKKKELDRRYRIKNYHETEYDANKARDKIKAEEEEEEIGGEFLQVEPESGIKVLDSWESWRRGRVERWGEDEGCCREHIGSGGEVRGSRQSPHLLRNCNSMRRNLTGPCRWLEALQRVSPWRHRGLGGGRAENEAAARRGGVGGIEEVATCKRVNVILSNYANRPASPDKHMCNRKVYDIYRGVGVNTTEIRGYTCGNNNVNGTRRWKEFW